MGIVAIKHVTQARTTSFVAAALLATFTTTLAFSPDPEGMDGKTLGLRGLREVAAEASSIQQAEGRGTWPGSLSCKNMNGEDVDWWMGYKMSKSSESLKEPGYTMAYWDSNETGPHAWHWDEVKGWPNALESTTKLLPYYQGTHHTTPTGFVTYNDQSCSVNPGSDAWRWKSHCNAQTTRWPPEHGFTTGHAKGFLIFNKFQGIWLMHSTPGFPLNSTFASNAGYQYTKDTYGQNFLCLTLRPKELDLVAEHLADFTFPAIQEGDMTSDRELHSLYPNMQRWIGQKAKGTWPKHGHRFTNYELTTKGGQRVKAFAKGASADKILWDDMVAPSLRTSLNVETWCGGSDADPRKDCMKSHCDEFHVQQITALNWKGFSQHHWEPSKSTHAKWGISTSRNAPWVCAGDINRQRSQYRRGGSAICLEHTNTWETLIDFVSEVEQCFAG